MFNRDPMTASDGNQPSVFRGREAGMTDCGVPARRSLILPITFELRLFGYRQNDRTGMVQGSIDALRCL